MLAILAPAHGRRLAAKALAVGLRPILRLVDNGIDFGDAATQLSEELADLADEFACGDVSEPVL